MNFRKGDEVPQWLAQGPDVTFGCDAVVEEYGDGYRVSPLAPLRSGECLIHSKSDCPVFPKPTVVWTKPLSTDTLERKP